MEKQDLCADDFEKYSEMSFTCDGCERDLSNEDMYKYHTSRELSPHPFLPEPMTGVYLCSECFNKYYKNSIPSEIYK